ncbi:MAG: hypothetical protein ACYC4U_11215 [Pirellulaceae bacterium]
MSDRGPWIQTLDGRALHLLGPQPADIQVGTLATVLSRICRFNGHCRQFYSVAEHSWRVYQVVSGQTADPAIRLAALLHDAHEAYSGFGDVCRPAKGLTPNVEYVEHKLDVAIAAHFGFPVELFRYDLVKAADAQLLATEARDLMGTPPKPWACLPPPLPAEILPYSIAEAAWLFECQARQLWRSVKQKEVSDCV